MYMSIDILEDRFFNQAWVLQECTYARFQKIFVCFFGNEMFEIPIILIIINRLYYSFVRFEKSYNFVQVFK